MLLTAINVSHDVLLRLRLLRPQMRQMPQSPQMLTVPGKTSRFTSFFFQLIYRPIPFQIRYSVWLILITTRPMLTTLTWCFTSFPLLRLLTYYLLHGYGCSVGTAHMPQSLPLRTIRLHLQLPQFPLPLLPTVLKRTSLIPPFFSPIRSFFFCSLWTILIYCISYCFSIHFSCEVDYRLKYFAMHYLHQKNPKAKTNDFRDFRFNDTASGMYALQQRAWKSAPRLG